MRDRKSIIVNGVTVTCYLDGSVERRFGKNGRLHRTFGSAHSDGYLVVGINGKKIRVHRIIAKAFLPDYCESLQVDHRFGDKTDNRPSRLRMATNHQNQLGSRKVKAGASSKYRGVCFCRRDGTWRATVSINHKRIHVGSFKDEIEAATAWDAAAKEHGYLTEALNFK